VASSGVQVSSTGIAIASTGVIVTSTANGDACCCGPTYNCAECGDCCFSDASTVDVTWSVDTVTSTSGDGAAGHHSGSDTGLPSQTRLSPGSANWFNNDYTTVPGEISVLVGCTTGSQGWLVSFNDAIGGTDHYEIEIGGSSTVSPMSGDCCGFNGTGTIRVTHRNAAGSVLGQVNGTGAVSIVVNNNLCCRESLHVCNKVENNCEGTCPASP
jgi:hypothetical protein